jgi:putative FmdB family regulatory protein
MPLYEYQCEACAHRFERIQKFSDPPLDVCPNCGKGPVVKLLSSPAIQFKGSGWYITDYARKDSGSRSTETKTDATKGESKGSETNETKADTKADAKSGDAAPAASDSKPTKTTT